MYYQQTPISEKPEMQTGIGITEAFGIMESGRKVATAFYHGEGKWTHAIKFWLKPITGVVMTEEQLEQIKTDQYHKGYDRGYDEGGTLF